MPLGIAAHGDAENSSRNNYSLRRVDVILSSSMGHDGIMVCSRSVRYERRRTKANVTVCLARSMLQNSDAPKTNISAIGPFRQRRMVNHQRAGAMTNSSWTATRITRSSLNRRRLMIGTGTIGKTKTPRALETRRTSEFDRALCSIGELCGPWGPTPPLDRLTVVFATSSKGSRGQMLLAFV